MAFYFFVSDLHGKLDRYDTLIELIYQELPSAVFLGGDLLPPIPPKVTPNRSFTNAFLKPNFQKMKSQLGQKYPRIFIILGNDDGRREEKEILRGEREDLWEYVHLRQVDLGEFNVYGYNYVPPTPFLLKDWERYDVSRYVDPGCISPEEGWRTFEAPKNVTRYATIQKDIEKLSKNQALSRSIFLFHTPPYQTKLDRAALDGQKIDYVPIDVHVGSIAVKRFIENRQPLLTLHGHVHESARLMGDWREKIGRTYAFTAAHDGPELALVRFDPKDLENASQELI